MKNKLDQIKSAIMAAFPDAEWVAIQLDSEIMKIETTKYEIPTEDEIETIITEGMIKWKPVKSVVKD